MALYDYERRLVKIAIAMENAADAAERQRLWAEYEEVQQEAAARGIQVG